MKHIFHREKDALDTIAHLIRSDLSLFDYYAKKLFKDEVLNNVKYFVETITKERPSGIKGEFVKKVSISPTMGPGININMESFGA